MRAAWVLAASLAAAGAAGAQEGDPAWPEAARRDPASVSLPAATRLKLRLGGDVVAEYAAAFDAMAPTGALFLLGPGTTREIQVAADRARVFLLYQQYDLDGDGAVSREEYDRHADVSWGSDLDAAGRAVLEREWEEGDRDGDGRITFEEMRQLALARHPVPPDRPLSEVEQVILTMDLDADGFVYWDEVAAVLEAAKGRP